MSLVSLAPKTKTARVATECLHELFERQADLRPSDPALVCDGEALSYAQLERRSNRLARYLRARGVGPGDLVGLYFRRSGNPIIAILAVLKSGAGYVPIDPDCPRDRVGHILADAGVALLLTEQALSAPVASVFEGHIISVDAHGAEIARQPSARLSRHESRVSPEDICYVIYTSGSTGRPKGVMIEHRNAVNYVCSVNEVYGVDETDRVYQGFSLAFDAAVEEVWLGLSTGATLVLGTSEVVRSGDEVARLLARKKVTVFSTVPTFLSMIEDELPTVRLLILGGEACTQDLVARWARPGLRMMNTYGPTEATVVTTYAECSPDKPVTIGRPLRGYRTYVMDEQMRPVRPGEPGELCIGGAGLARGYLNRPDLTREKFVANPCGGGNGSAPRLYRSGDLVRLNGDGELEFLGRIDGQVKIRGFRIELSEIEAALRDHPAVRAAAVKVAMRDGVSTIAAYVVPREPAEVFDRDSLAEALRQRLPDYMVPTSLDLVDELPALSSGKIDRARLPEPTSPLVKTNGRAVVPRTELERRVAGVWKKVFHVSEVSIEDDFFLDLGGHSLLAAQAVSRLREEAGLNQASVRDVYQHRTIKELCEHLSSAAAGASKRPAKKWYSPRKRSAREVFESVPRSTRFTCVALQVVSIYFIFAGLGAPVVLAFLMTMGVLAGQGSAMVLIFTAFALSAMAYPVSLATGILAKWLLIGRYKPGRHPLWGLYYFRWWLATRFQAMSGAGALAGTPLASLYYRLMGAKVGRNCLLDTMLCGSFDLVSIGEGTSIGAETQLLGYRIEDGELVLGRIEIGSRCFVGIHSALELNSRMRDGARLDDLSLLPEGETMKPGESRRGSPAQPARIDLPGGSDAQTRRRHPVVFGLLHLVGLYAVWTFLGLCGVPGLVALLVPFWFFGAPGLLAAAPVAAPLGVFCLTLGVAAAKVLVIGRMKPGVYRVESGFYLRKWCFDTLLRICRGLLTPVYATLYLPPWLRLLGAKIGARTEVSTVLRISPDLLVAGDESFFADAALIGGMRIYGGRFQIGTNRVGCRTFVGNSAMLPIGAELGNESLLGCMSVPPVGGGCPPDGSKWLGSPSFPLPRLQEFEKFDDRVVYRPTVWLYAQRLVIDALRILIPSFVAVGVFVVSLLYLVGFSRLVAPWALFLITPAFGIGLSIGAGLVVAAIKWVLMGRFRPTVKPLWSMFVWLNELVNGAYESIAAPALSFLLGTPFFAAYLRLLGCKVGRHAYIGTTLFSEFDLVEIGDYVALNVGATIQTHLFEDRIMKASYLKIGDECTVANMAVILYDTEMKPGSTLGPLSLLMKGETIPPSARCLGIPSRVGSTVEGS